MFEWNNKCIESRHHWTYGENYKCCEKFIDKYVIEKSYENIDVLVSNLMIITHIKQSSIKMKLQNIKYLFKEYKIKDTAPISYLPNVSEENRRAFLDVIKAKNVTIKTD